MCKVLGDKKLIGKGVEENEEELVCSIGNSSGSGVFTRDECRCMLRVKVRARRQRQNVRSVSS
jgi:hypothetical protein